MHSEKSDGSVAILLCVFQGEQFLQQQLDSFYLEQEMDICLWASDDGSTDETTNLLQEYKQKFSKNLVTVVSGPRKGPSFNFLSLLRNPSVEANYFAFSDQDDIWEKDKLSRAIACLENLPDDTPAVYCSRTRVVDQENREIGLSPLFAKPPSFANALVQSIGGGNTMVLNSAARKLINKIELSEISSHDWWIYLLVSGAGGTVIYDDSPSLRYRQHGNNQIGANNGWRARYLRIVAMLFKDRFKIWIDQNLAGLYLSYELLTPENKKLLDHFSVMRNRNLRMRLWGVISLGLYRQTLVR